MENSNKFNSMTHYEKRLNVKRYRVAWLELSWTLQRPRWVIDMWIDIRKGIKVVDYQFNPSLECRPIIITQHGISVVQSKATKCWDCHCIGKTPIFLSDYPHKKKLLIHCSVRPYTNDQTGKQAFITINYQSQYIIEGKFMFTQAYFVEKHLSWQVNQCWRKQTNK